MMTKELEKLEYFHALGTFLYSQTMAFQVSTLRNPRGPSQFFLQHVGTYLLWTVFICPSIFLKIFFYELYLYTLTHLCTYNWEPYFTLAILVLKSRYRYTLTFACSIWNWSNVHYCIEIYQSTKFHKAV